MPLSTFTNQNFEEEIIKSSVPVLVDAYADWCGPCKMLGPIIEELAQDNEGKMIKIGKLNVDESPEIAEKYNILSIPTLLFVKEGKVVEQMTGMQDKESLQEKIDQLMNR